MKAHRLAIVVALAAGLLLAIPVNAPATAASHEPRAAQGETILVQASANISAKEWNNASAFCPGTTRVTGGGGSTSDPAYLVESYPQGNGWTAGIYNPLPWAQTLTVWAVCSTLPSMADLILVRSHAPVAGINAAYTACPNSFITVAGGGYQDLSQGISYLTHSSRPKPFWWLVKANPVPGESTMTAVALCARESTTKIRTYTSTATISPVTGWDGAFVECPEDGWYRISGGGSVTDPNGNTFLSASVPTYQNGWTVWAVNNGSTETVVTAQVYCLKP